MNPSLLLKQYHPRSLVSLGALWTACTRLNACAEQHNLCGRQFILVQNLFNHPVKRKSETVVESHTINSYTFGRRLIHGGVCLGDYEGERLWGRESDCPDRLTSPSGAPGNSGPSATISRASPMGKWPFLLSIDLLEAGSPSWDEELVNAPSEDEPLDKLSEKEKEVSPEVELVLVEATSAPDFDELRAE
ncbi:LOW QUALITY PROTEIN: hypothetical protein Cgig2_027184 [Carnegiea gigantea]|uniref:Uncharacterized protein n=1 Tax=Carnegiea gigantea TaxID=171969 RepID=A0A9Q1KTL2_9CARY|nr:LOW QUALITY PROTEIN: hypothetical protein Cgig2_027184 [Carnegiea gigantea]